MLIDRDLHEIICFISKKRSPPRVQTNRIDSKRHLPTTQKSETQNRVCSNNSEDKPHANIQQTIQKTRGAFEPRSENGETKTNSDRQPPNRTHWRKSDRSGPGCWIRLLEAEHGGEAGGHAARRKEGEGGRDSPKWPLTPHQGNTITTIRRFLLQQ